jgi:hypothetical protein
MGSGGRQRRRIVVAALLLVAATAPAAPPRRIDVRVGVQLDRPSPRPGACIGDRCGELDADGLLPVVVTAPPGSLVWIRQALAQKTPRGHVVRLDPLSLLEDRALALLATVPDELLLPIRVEGPQLAVEEVVAIRPNASFGQALRRRILGADSGTLSFAAPYDAALLRAHPTLVVQRWVRGGREHLLDDLGAPVAPWVLPSSGDHRVRDLELVAVLRITPTLLERCARCALGDFMWPEVEFRCSRVRLDSEVKVFTAREGRAVMSRTFKGPVPGPCGDNIDHLKVRGQESPEIRDWLERDVARAR